MIPVTLKREVAESIERYIARAETPDVRSALERCLLALSRSRDTDDVLFVRDVAQLVRHNTVLIGVTERLSEASRRMARLRGAL